jgi:predicted NBD/HSP70 family sugar kinase
MREKADTDLVRRQNRHIVLETLRQHGPIPRIQLGRLTGLSPASITSITTQLINERAMLELQGPSGQILSRRGRPTVRVDLNPQAASIIAMKISIDEIELALADFGSDVIARKIMPVATYEMPADVFGCLAGTTIRAFLSDNQLRPKDVARIGIAAQGVADTRNGSIAWSPAFRARNIAIVAPIQDELGIPCTLANDANMIAEGLMARERNNDHGTAAVVFMGYGVGMGLVIDGDVYHGATGAAAEFGHMNHLPGGALCRCGRAGCLEAYASDYGILRSANNLPDSTPPPTSAVDPAIMRALESAARAGDVKAIAAYQKAGRAIGFGLARLIAILNPDRIVLAGPGTLAFDLIEPALRQAIDEAVVSELRSHVKIESIAIDTDMIIAGTIDATLRFLDSEVSAMGSLRARTIQMEIPA